jgi:hypothetical protein
MFVGQAAGWKSTMLQHEIAIMEVVVLEHLNGSGAHPYLQRS